MPLGLVSLGTRDVQLVVVLAVVQDQGVVLVVVEMMILDCPCSTHTLQTNVQVHHKVGKVIFLGSFQFHLDPQLRLVLVLHRPMSL